MATYAIGRITCDHEGCSARHETTLVDRSPNLLSWTRQEARDKGWQIGVNKQLCPEHRTKRRD